VWKPDKTGEAACRVQTIGVLIASKFARGFSDHPKLIG